MDRQCVFVPALMNKNVTLMTHAYVEKLETDASGKKITKVVADIKGEKIIFNADTRYCCLWCC